MSTPPWHVRHSWTTSLGLSAVYVAAALLGRATRLDGTTFALVWPAAGVALLWFSLSWSRRAVLRRDAALLVAATLAVNLATGSPLLLALVFGATNLVQAVVAAGVLARRAQAWRMRTPGDLALLVGACAAGAVTSGLTGALGAAVVVDAALGPALLGWVMRNLSGSLIVAVSVLSLLDRRPRRPRWSEAVELAVLAVAFVLGYGTIFGLDLGLPLGFLLLPLSLWVALRVSTPVAALHLLGVGTVVVTSTIGGHGPFSAGPPAEQMLLAQSFVCVVALMTMSLAVFRDQRADLVDRLEQTHREAAEHAALLGTFLETVDVGVVACDAAGHLSLFNRASREFHGMPADPSLDPADWAHAYDLFEEDGTTPLAPERIPLFRALHEGSVADAVFVIAPEGLPARTVRCGGSQLRTPEGALRGAVVAMTDITASRAAEQLLVEREQRFRAAFHDSPTPIAYLTLDGRVRDANEALRRMLMATSSRLLGRTLADRAHPEDQVALQAHLLLGSPGTEPYEVRLLRYDGTSVWCEVTATRCQDRIGDSPYLLVQMHDVHLRKANEQALERAAKLDPLTGLENRQGLSQRLELALDPHVGEGAALLFLDLDGFKAVNDTHGHDTGDAVLVQVAMRLLDTVRPGDTVVRLGGDEFVVLCPLTHPTERPLGASGISAMVQRIERAVSAPMEHGGLALRIGVSVGSAVARPGQDAGEVLEEADRAMYRRKEQRRAAQVPVPRGVA